MSLFRKLDLELPNLLRLFKHCDKWLIVINADPDALASAMALRRIMSHRVDEAVIAHVNEVRRPDNRAMIRRLRIPLTRLTPTLAAGFNRLAMVDSQPHHHPEFAPYHFSVVIDHHPLEENASWRADYRDIRPGYGAVSTMMTEYLHNLKVRPGMLLATALLYGIKTDTKSFERPFIDADIRAFRHLAAKANMLLLSKIARVEMDKAWLPVIAAALGRLSPLSRRGYAAHLGEVDSPDILVILADFCLHVDAVSWAVISGVWQGRAVVVFRGDGLSLDMGVLAKESFGALGPAGGHATMARAEFDLNAMPRRSLEDFVCERLEACPGKPVRPQKRPR
ncbi:MAG: DHH family phosphoesterase [Desulfovibrionaceae bacterium]|nr:DHH family phosphoesterase [Desulfovibrionaceae bacterium]MBF0515131.1 DHH family phosphoesterase [Desulfovibrionaceae bacterium]